MALIICDECKNKISDKAVMCPNCGCPTNIEEKENKPTLKFNEIIRQNKITSGFIISAILIIIFNGTYLLNGAKLVNSSFKSSATSFTMTILIIISGISFYVLLNKKILNKSKKTISIILFIFTILAIIIFDFDIIRKSNSYRQGYVEGILQSECKNRYNGAYINGKCYYDKDNVKQPFETKPIK